MKINDKNWNNFSNWFDTLFTVLLLLASAFAMFKEHTDVATYFVVLAIYVQVKAKP